MIKGDYQKALCIFTKYSKLKEHAYLTNELVDELSIRGMHSTVVAYEQCDQFIMQTTMLDRDEIFVNLSRKIKYLKYFIAWPVLFFVMFKLALKREKYDILVMNTPLLTMFPVLFFLPILRVRKKWAIIFDLFPIHQVQAGAIMSTLEAILRRLELWGLGLFDRYGVMGERNKVAVASYYQLCPKLIHITGIWGVKESYLCKSEYDGARKKIRMVFGGQLTAGRRLDLLISFLKDLRKELQNERDICVDIFSSGFICNQYKVKYHQDVWINFCQPLDRHTYIAALSNYDFGLIVTDENVTLPTLPSKIVDYINASLNIIAMVEDACELRERQYKSDKVILISFSYTNSDLERVRDHLISIGSVEPYTEAMKSLFSVERTVNVLIK